MEERGNIIQRIITDIIVLNNPKLGKNDYRNIIQNFGDKLIFIKKNEENIPVDDYIPCLFYRRKTSPNFLIFFHGNSENIFQIEHYALDLRSYLDMNVILVEYPGYFLKTNKDSNPNIILRNSLKVYEWIKNTFKASDNQIFICGRSLGTSPAIYLSSHIKPDGPKALFLISAFTSIKNAAGNYSPFVEKIFKSIDYIKEVRCPILFIHGIKDNLIPFQHSIDLKSEVEKNNKEVRFEPRPNMDHNNFNLKEDIIDQIKIFCKDKNILLNENIYNNNEMNNSDNLYKIPIEIRKILESYIFDINDFKISQKIDKKNASILMNLTEKNFALINGSKITIYNERILIDNEIDLSSIKDNKVIIKCLYQNKKENLICATEEGDIFLFKLDRNQIEILKSLSIEEEIYKIGDFFDNNICLLSKNYIKIYDSDFSKEIKTFENKKTFMNFCKFSTNGFVMIKQNVVSLYKFENDNFNQIQNINLKISGLPDTLVEANQYLLIASIGNIFSIDIFNKSYKITKNKSINLEPYEEILFLYKIHDQFLLASTDIGSILTISIKENREINIIAKNIINKKISSVLMIDYEMLLIAGNNEMDILTVPKKEVNQNSNCLVF